MTNGFENALNDCTALLLKGLSVQDCLALYPEFADELRPHVEAVARMAAEYYRQPSEQAFDRSRRRLRGELAALGREDRLRSERSESLASRLTKWLGMQAPRWAAAAAGVLVFIAGTGVAAASGGSLPGDALYPVKRGVEQARLAFEFDDRREAELHLTYARRRTEEAAELIDQGRTDQVRLALAGLNGHLASASERSQKLEEREAETLRAAYEESASRALEKLEQAVAQAPKASQPAAKEALEETAKAYAHYKQVPAPDRPKEPIQGPTPTPPSTATPAVIIVTGRVEVIGEGFVEVGGQRVAIDAGLLRAEGIAEGAEVRIDVQVEGLGLLRGLGITVLAGAPTPSAPPATPGLAEIRGVIEDVTPAGGIVVDGQDVAIDDATRVVGVLEAGARASVVGFVDAGGRFVATQVVVEPVGAGPTPGPTAEPSPVGTPTPPMPTPLLPLPTPLPPLFPTPSPTAQPSTPAPGTPAPTPDHPSPTPTLNPAPTPVATVQVSGVLSKDASGRLTVNGTVVRVGDLTEVAGTLEVGATVRVDGVWRPDDTFMAVRIEVVQPPHVVETNGLVHAIAGDQVTVGADIVVLTDAAVSGNLELGAAVRVTGARMPDGSIFASYVEVLAGPPLPTPTPTPGPSPSPAPGSTPSPTPTPGSTPSPTPTPAPQAFLITGVVEEIAGDVWTVVDDTDTWAITVTPETDIGLGILEGLRVTIEGVAYPDGLNVALRIALPPLS